MGSHGKKIEEKIEHQIGVDIGTFENKLFYTAAFSNTC